MKVCSECGNDDGPYQGPPGWDALCGDCLEEVWEWYEASKPNPFPLAELPDEDPGDGED